MMRIVTERTRSVSRALVLITFLSALVLGLAPAAHAQDTAAVAVNTKDGTSMFRFAFGVIREMDDVVAASNGAAAVSSCTDCQTVAVSIQIVLVMSDPSVIAPENTAIALNIECTLCETGAFAYQFVISTGGPVYLSQAGLQALHDVQEALRELGKTFEEGGLSLEDVQAELDILIAEVEEVLANELISAGKPEPEPTPTESVDVEPSEPSQTTTATSG